MTDELHERKAGATLGVRFPERVIDLIAVPYDEEAVVVIGGRAVRERVAAGAFAGVTGDVVVNRAHDRERPLGKVVKFHPGDPRGLRTELRISDTSEGRDILALADDGLLSASIGFAPLPGGEEWSADRSSVTVTRAVLGHIALTGDPAYTGARVLAVRGNMLGNATSDLGGLRTPTPILDRILLERRLEAVGMVLDAPPAAT